MKNVVKVFICLMAVCFVSCTKNTKQISNSNDVDFKNMEEEITYDKELMEKAVIYDKDFFTVELKFSNLIYNIKGKKYKFPIYKGVYGDMDFDRIYQYAEDKGIVRHAEGFSRYCFPIKKEEFKETFASFLNFYKGNILKNVNLKKPDVFDNDCGSTDSRSHWRIQYKFILNDRKFTFDITIPSTIDDDINRKKIKTPFDITGIYEEKQVIYCRFW